MDTMVECVNWSRRDEIALAIIGGWAASGNTITRAEMLRQAYQFADEILAYKEAHPHE